MIFGEFVIDVFVDEGDDWFGWDVGEGMVLDGVRADGVVVRVFAGEDDVVSDGVGCVGDVVVG